MKNTKENQAVTVGLETKKLVLMALTKVLLSNCTISKNQYDQMIRKIEKIRT